MAATTKRSPRDSLPLRKRIRQFSYLPTSSQRTPDSNSVHGTLPSSQYRHPPTTGGVPQIIQENAPQVQNVYVTEDGRIATMMHGNSTRVVQQMSTSTLSSYDTRDDDVSKFKTSVQQNSSSRSQCLNSKPSTNRFVKNVSQTENVLQATRYGATAIFDNAVSAQGEASGASFAVGSYGGSRLSFSRFASNPTQTPKLKDEQHQNSLTPFGSIVTNSSRLPVSNIQPQVVQASTPVSSTPTTTNALFTHVAHVGTLRKRRRPVITPPERGGFAPVSWPKPPSNRVDSSSMVTTSNVPVPVSPSIFVPIIAATRVDAHLSPNELAPTPQVLPLTSVTRTTVGMQNQEESFPCSDCNAVFSKQQAQTKHYRAVHLNKRPHACMYCERRFGEKHNLNSHVRTVHLKERNHICPHCRRGFGAKPDLNKHIRSVHLKERPFQCEYCEKRFGSRPELRKHISTVHLKQKPHKCPSCNKSFGLKHHLTLHLRRVHFPKSNITENANTTTNITNTNQAPPIVTAAIATVGPDSLSRVVSGK